MSTTTYRMHTGTMPGPESVELFVLHVPAPFTSTAYHPRSERGPARFEDAEVKPGLYPARVETSPEGDPVAVVDLDVLVTARTTWRWGIWRHRTHPYVHDIDSVAWYPHEVINGAAAVFHADGRTPAAIWRRIA
jgi:hypothetical protein